MHSVQLYINNDLNIAFSITDQFFSLELHYKNGRYDHGDGLEGSGHSTEGGGKGAIKADLDMEKRLFLDAKGFERAKLAVEKRSAFLTIPTPKYPIETPNSFEIYSKQISESIKPTVKETIE